MHMHVSYMHMSYGTTVTNPYKLDIAIRLWTQVDSTANNWAKDWKSTRFHDKMTR